MNDEDRTDQPPATRMRAKMPFKSYNFLLTLSKKLGNVATKSFVEVREFLNNDVSLPSAERFLYTMSRRRQKGRAERGQGLGGTYENTNTVYSQKKVEEGSQAKKDPGTKLDKVLERSHEILAGANTVFPITLFHDTVFVDRTKVTIIKRNFFWSEDVMSIRIEDVLNVTASVGPLFGSLTIVSRVVSTVDHFEITHFWRSDAIHLKHVIQGYIIALHNKLDIDHLSKDDLIKTLQELGHDRTVTSV